MRRVLTTLLAGCMILASSFEGVADDPAENNPARANGDGKGGGSGGGARESKDGQSGRNARRRRAKRPRRPGRRPGGGGGGPQEKAGALQKPGEMVRRLDANGDGILSADEIPEPLRERFGKLDANQDGSIDGQELKAGRDKLHANPDGPGPGSGGPPGGPFGGPPGGPFGAPPGGSPRGEQGPGRGVGGGRFKQGPGTEAMLKKLDRNGNGKVSRDELPEAMRGRFDKLDRNADGSVDATEMTEARARLLGPGADGPPGPPDGSRRFGSGGGGLNPEMAFQRFDKDGDGKLAGDEIPEPMRQRVGRADTDGDGAISKDEFESAMSRLRERMAGEGGQRLRAAYGAADVSGKQAFNEQDVDANGRVTRSEAKGPLASQFDKLDANHDGKLDTLEVENGLKPATPGP